MFNGKLLKNLLLNNFWIKTEDRLILKHCKTLIDEEFYYTNNPDVLDAKFSAIDHYFRYGWREGRDPSKYFSTTGYVYLNPDVKLNDENPLLHLLRRRIENGQTDRPSNAELVASSKIQDGEFRNTQSGEYEKAFDIDFYVKNNPDVNFDEVEPLHHYENIGWREGRNPSDDFSTNYYLESNPDIKSGNINPFRHYIEHGRAERRQPAPYRDRLMKQAYRPLVSVIVPNYNHKRYLPKRLESIVNQNYTNIEIIILDDCSSDGSQDFLVDFVGKHPDLVRYFPNDKNTGKIFDQWRKGFDLARGELVWICESDDFCELDFLTKIVPHFADTSINLAFGRIQFSNEDGSFREGLDSYRSEAEPGKVWESVCIRPAAEWFRGAFGIANIIPNVGGCVIRRSHIAEQEWNVASSFKVVGDWYLYLVFARGGRIAYEPKAVAYFRQHGANTSVLSFDNPVYYVEHEKIILSIIKYWGTSDRVIWNFISRVEAQYARSTLSSKRNKLSRYFSTDLVKSSSQERKHIVIGILGFRLGGGEIFPIELANEFYKLGFIVSIVVLHTDGEEKGIRRRLNSGITVYASDVVREMGVDRFLSNIGASCFHSHYIGLEYLFLVDQPKLKFDGKYLVTLHGSYDGADIEPRALINILSGVDTWVYLTKKNLQHFKDIPIDPLRVFHIPNGCVLDAREFGGGRASLNISGNDFVFTVVSRAIAPKGWREAILALQQLRQHVSQRVVLLLCGDGEDRNNLEQEFGLDNDVYFLGYQEKVHGLYKISDCAFLPTRFVGESYPLTIIQAMQVGCPVIATNIGHIEKMLHFDGLCGGLVVEPTDENDVFVSRLVDAMKKIVFDKSRRQKLGNEAKKIGGRYSIERVSAEYGGLMFDKD